MIPFLFSPIGKWLGAAVLLIAAVAGFKLWLVNHDAGVRSELVALYETKVTAAKDAEAKRQSDIAAALIKAANDRAAGAKASEDAIKAHTEIRISDYEAKLNAANRACLLDDSDLPAIMHHN